MTYPHERMHVRTHGYACACVCKIHPPRNAQELTEKDVLAAWSGIRPLVRDPRHTGKSTAKLSRQHVVTSTPSGNAYCAVAARKLVWLFGKQRSIRREIVRARTLTPMGLVRFCWSACVHPLCCVGFLRLRAQGW
jgi:hypothetical protein